MALRFFRIPVEGNATMEGELNALLAGRKVLRVTRELVQRKAEPAWAVCDEYLESSVGPALLGKRHRAQNTLQHERPSPQMAVTLQSLGLRTSAIPIKSRLTPQFANFLTHNLSDA